MSIIARFLAFMSQENAIQRDMERLYDGFNEALEKKDRQEAMQAIKAMAEYSQQEATKMLQDFITMI